MRATRSRQPVIAGFAVLILVPGCWAGTVNFASISGNCIAAKSVTAVGTLAFVSDPPTTCPPIQVGVNNYDLNETASAAASSGSLRISGAGIDAGLNTGVSALASYTDAFVITGPISGPGTLYLLFATSFGNAILDGGLHGQFAPSIGTGGVSFHCFDFDCPAGPTKVEFALPFTYGVPFAFTISLSAEAIAEEDFGFGDSVNLLAMQAGPGDTISEVPEPASSELIFVGLAVFVTMAAVGWRAGAAHTRSGATEVAGPSTMYPKPQMLTANRSSLAAPCLRVTFD